MRRIQFIELHEQPWLPASMRDAATDALQFGLNLLNIYAPAAPLLESALDSTQAQSIVDLCSGGGGPWCDLSRKLRARGRSLEILLTDKFPNFAAASRNAAAACENHITYFQKSVDAANLPHELVGFRTMFTSFHHFAPAQARAILQNAVDGKQGIAIFEVTKRSGLTMALMFPWVLLLSIAAPWARPFRWSRLLWNYVLPLVPIILIFDGVVSCLRTYRPQELRAIMATLAAPEYQWSIGEHSGSMTQMPISYLIGYPRHGS